MLNLELFAGTRWIDLVPGVRIEVLPMGTTLMQAVWSDPAMAGSKAEAGDDDPKIELLPFARAIARRAIVAWEGVGDGKGRAVPVTRDNIDALMEVPAIHAAFRTRYIEPGIAVVAEGNGSAAAPNGTSVAAATTARPARRAATPAPTSKPNRKAAKGGRSGT